MAFSRLGRASVEFQVGLCTWMTCLHFSAPLPVMAASPTPSDVSRALALTREVKLDPPALLRAEPHIPARARDELVGWTATSHDTLDMSPWTTVSFCPPARIFSLRSTLPDASRARVTFLGRLADGGFLHSHCMSFLWSSRTWNRKRGGSAVSSNFLSFLWRSTSWILGKTPPWLMVTPFSNLASSSSFAMASRTWSRSDYTSLVIPRSISRELQDLSDKVLPDSAQVDLVIPAGFCTGDWRLSDSAGSWTQGTAIPP